MLLTKILLQTKRLVSRDNIPTIRMPACFKNTKKVKRAIGMAILMSKLISVAKPYYRVCSVAKRHVQEFPRTKMDTAQPVDYLLVLPEPLNDNQATNEILRIPKAGEPEIDFSKITPECVFRGLSKTICTFENFIIDFNNGYQDQPAKTIEEFFMDIESHLYPMDYAYNIMATLMTMKSDQFNHKELQQLVARYISARDGKQKDNFEEALKFYASKDKSLSPIDKKMLQLYYPTSSRRKVKLSSDDDYNANQYLKHIQLNMALYRANLAGANDLFSHTVDDPDILAAVSTDFDDCQDLHHKERTPLKVTIPTYRRFMEICPDRFVRQSLWRERNKRCSPKGVPRFNNLNQISSIRVYKRKLANMLGFRTHVEYKLENALAQSRQQILGNLEKLNDENAPKLRDRLQELNDYAADNSFEDPGQLGIQAYDIDFWIHKYMYDILIGISEAETRSYFPLPVVLQGLQKFFYDYFGVELKEHKDRPYKLWANDLQVFEVTKQNELIGKIVFDPHQREGKQLLEPYYGRIRNCNLDLDCLPMRFISTPYKLNPATNRAQLTMVDTMNLFYIFGTVLQQLLYRYKYNELNTQGGLETDANNFLPNLCVAYLMRDHQILQSCSDRGGSKPIDAELSSRILKAFDYFESFKLWQELYLAHLDIEVYSTMSDIDNLAKQVYDTYSPFKRYTDDFDYCALEEIFAGSNDGAQYANLWSKQLANSCLQNGDKESIRRTNIKLLDALFDPNNFDTSKKISPFINHQAM